MRWGNLTVDMGVRRGVSESEEEGEVVGRGGGGMVGGGDCGGMVGGRSERERIWGDGLGREGGFV